MGLAVGCIGMSRDDFCACDFDEFAAICHAWHERGDALSRDSWERTRTLAAITIQPHVRKKLTPRQLLPLPWDCKKQIRSDAPVRTAEEERKRFEEVVRRLGDETAL